MADADIELVAAQLREAVARRDVDEIGQIITEHLGDLMLHDMQNVLASVADIEIGVAVRYPALAVFHRHRSMLARYVPKGSSLPQFTGKGRLRWVYAMAFLRAIGRIDAAQGCARRLADDTGKAIASGETARSAGYEWLVWFQMGLTRLAAGDLQQASDDLGTAYSYVRVRSNGGVADAAQLTSGYRAFVAALMGNTDVARHNLARIDTKQSDVGNRFWALRMTTRAIVEVEEHTDESGEAVAALDLIDEQDAFWPFVLLARTRYAELIGRPLDSLAFIEAAQVRNAPSVGSLAYDILVARHIEVLIVLGRLNAARTVYEEEALDAPHCRLAHLALLLGELDYRALERATEVTVASPKLSPAQRVQAQALGAMGMLARDGVVPDYVAPGLAHALSQRAHRRIALMFPPVFREVLAPYLLPDAIDDWRRSKMNIRLWNRGHFLEGAAFPKLTPRQLTMLRHIEAGHSYGQIADGEHVSVNTVKSHLKALYRKLGASNREDAIASARRWGLLDEAG